MRLESLAKSLKNERKSKPTNESHQKCLSGSIWKLAANEHNRSTNNNHNKQLARILYTVSPYNLQ